MLVSKENQAKKAYSHLEVEPKWTKIWLENDYFKTKINKTSESFSIALPPPNVTGELHMGHALSGTIQDILIRYNRMLGKDVLWQIGTDHAGIGTQIVVEKDLRKKEHKRKEDLGREAFIERTKAWKEEYGNKIIEQMKTMGFSPDYSRVRYTMDDHYAAAVLNAFIKYFNDGKIYRGSRITNWCPKCLTSLSDLEIDKETCNKKLYEIKYYLMNSNEFLTVATTRPETMFGDRAVAINPNDTRFKKYSDQVKKKPGSIKLKIPFTNKLIPLILDEHVKTDFGTGALKVTPAHDANDYEIGNRHNLERPIIMDEKGLMRACEDVPEKIEEETIHGLDRYIARDIIVKALEANSQLKKVSEYEQEKDLHDRCNTEIEPYLSDQWYVDMKELSEIALETEASGRSKFTPERYKVIFKNWLENIQDWCISRQIWWGHRIPIYYYEGEPQAGDKSYKSLDGKTISYYAAKEARDASHKQDEDVLDTWFSSALWPFETMKDNPEIFKHFYPTDVLATAREIINLWVSRMIYSSEYFEGKEPFKDILIHPVVQTPDGKRMSKSKGNAIDPLEMVEKYGADASRMWYASVGVLGQQDVRFPGRKDKKEGWLSDTFEQYRKFCNKLFNASKFVMMKLGDGFEAKTIDDWDLSNANIADKWILDKFTRVLKDIENAFNDYDLGKVQDSIYSFLWFDFCDWYIELTKVESNTDKELQKQILFYILEASLRALHPIMPFITEEIWQELKVYSREIASPTARNDSICFAQYPRANQKLKDSGDAAKQMSFVIQLISSIRNTRQSLNISWSNELSILIDTKDIFEKEAIQAAEEFLKSVVKAKELKYTDEVEKPVNTVLIDNTKLSIPLAGLVDFDKLKSSIGSKITKLEKDIEILEKRLSSENFVNNASPEKVQETKDNLESFNKQKSLFEEELLAFS